MTKQEIILRLVESLNRGNSCDVGDRVFYAVNQYKQMVACGIIKEDKE